MFNFFKKNKRKIAITVLAISGVGLICYNANALPYLLNIAEKTVGDKPIATVKNDKWQIAKSVLIIWLCWNGMGILIQTEGPKLFK